MAGNKRRKQENSGVRIFLYVVVVLALLGAMGYLFYYSRSQTKERQAYIRELESKESATRGWANAQPEEPATEESTENIESTEDTNNTNDMESAEVDSTDEIESTESISAENEESVEQASGTDSLTGIENENNTSDYFGAANSVRVGSTESTDSVEGVGNIDGSGMQDASMSGVTAENPRILVLNGTGKSGVAAYWKRLLLGKGLTNVVMADYKGTVEDHTVIYVAEGSSSPEGIRELFANAEYLSGGLDGVSDNIRIAAGQTQFDSYEIWIVVGKDDALHD